MSMKEWNNFFIDAGIPKNVAAQYASVFHSNRMTFDMLMDLNKEYLKDLEITVLGDVIAVLRHAKTVQQKRTTEKVLMPENGSKPQGSSSRIVIKPPTEQRIIKTQPTEQRIVKTLTTPPKQSEPKVTAKIPVKTTLTSRLGPPKSRNFNETPPKKVTPSIFERLDRGDEQESDPYPDSKSPSILRKRIREPSESEVVDPQVLKRPSEKTHDKRVSFEGKRAPEPRKLKKYIKVTTLANGQKLREVIEPDDPLLERAIIQKKSFSTSSLPRSVPISSVPISKPVVHQDVRLRVGAKVSERIGTKVSDRIGAKISENRATLVADREPQRSVKSRLSSPKYTPLRITPPTSSLHQEPRSRKRITAPSDHGEEPDRKYMSVGSAKSRLGARISY